jgi:hypothetical protein
MTDCPHTYVRIATLKSDNKALVHSEFYVFACKKCGTLFVDQATLRPIQVSSKAEASKQ